MMDIVCLDLEGVLVPEIWIAFAEATVKALQSAGFDTIAAGDSFNDLGMIKASRAGFLFRTTDQIKKDYPELKAFETYDEFLAAIKEVLE